MIERAALLSGTVGAGKTTIGEELAGLLKDRGEPHAFIDLDRLSELWPAPEDDRFNGRLILANLAAIRGTSLRQRTRSLVMSGVVESATSVEKYRTAIGGCPLTVGRSLCARTSDWSGLRPRSNLLPTDFKNVTSTGTPTASPGISIERRNSRGGTRRVRALSHRHLK